MQNKKNSFAVSNRRKCIANLRTHNECILDKILRNIELKRLLRKSYLRKFKPLFICKPAFDLNIREYNPTSSELTTNVEMSENLNFRET